MGVWSQFWFRLFSVIFFILYAVALQFTPTGSAATNPDTVSDEEAEVLIKCVSCGLAFIDPMENEVIYNFL